MRHPARIAPLLALVALLAVNTIVAAAETRTECGAYTDYVAPDPGTATPGSITFGFNGTPEVIAADAVLSPAAAASLPFLQGGTPTGLQVTTDAGQITALGFVPSCTVSGAVVFVPDALGPGQDAYFIDDRIVAPVAVLAGNAGLMTVIGVPAANGHDLSLTFDIDVSSGIPQSFTATTSASGAVVLLGADVLVDGATVGGALLLGEVIDQASGALLTQAASSGATVQVGIVGLGSIDVQGGPVTVTIVLSVTIDASPTPTPAPLPNTSAAQSTPFPATAVVLLGVACMLLLTVGIGVRRT
jgi:hypothetical protein